MVQALIDLALLLIITTALVMILRILKQPPIIAYIIAGVFIGPTVFNIPLGEGFIETFSSIGIAFLLFVVGISLDWRSLKRVGWVSAITGIGQVIFSTIIGYVLSRLFGFGITESLFIGIALAFSSTIIVIKFLTDKQDLDNLYGKIALGFLLVQDLIAIIALMFINTITTPHASFASSIMWSLVKVAFAIGISWAINRHILPSLLKFAGKSQEVLFLFSVTWCFGFAVFFELLGFTLEVGALAAGLMLASTQYSYEIASRIKPLRDFFIILFFIVLGSGIHITGFDSIVFHAIVFSAFVLIGIPAVLLVILGLLGFSKRTAFFAGLTVAQISEFSLILIALGVKQGVVGTGTQSTITLVALITILGSTYLVQYAKPLFERFGPMIPYYRAGVHKHEDKKEHHKRLYDAILFGYNRIGYSVLEHFENKKKNFLVIDFNPEVVQDLQNKGIPAIFGDADDAELFQELRLDKTELVVSTIPDKKTNSLILQHALSANDETVTILTAVQVEDALLLYEEGADYVIIPHLVGGDHAAIMLDTLSDNLDTFLKKKDHHVKQLKHRHKHEKHGK